MSALKKTGCGAGGGAGCLLLVFLVGNGLVFLIEVPFVLASGWAMVLVRAASDSTPSLDGITTFFALIVAMSVIGHWWIRRLTSIMCPPRQWRPQHSASLVMMLLLMLVVTMASAGVVHQAGWMVGGAPLVESSWSSGVQTRHLRSACFDLERGRRRLEDKLHLVVVRAEPFQGLVFPRNRSLRDELGGVRCADGVLIELDGQKLANVLDELRRGQGSEVTPDGWRSTPDPVGARDRHPPGRAPSTPP